MPGKKLEGELKVICAKIYESNPVKFHRIVIWVYRTQKAGYKDEVLAEVLKMFYPYCGRVDGWWKYLNSLLAKAHARCEEKECNGYKTADLTHIAAILKKAFGYRHEIKD